MVATEIGIRNYDLADQSSECNVKRGYPISVGQGIRKNQMASYRPGVKINRTRTDLDRKFMLTAKDEFHSEDL